MSTKEKEYELGNEDKNKLQKTLNQIKDEIV